MHQIEDDLKAALRRKPAPPGFAARVLERVEERKSLRKPFRQLMIDRPWILAAAAFVLMTISAGVFEYQRYIRNRNEAAFQNTLTAISIATLELDRAKNKAFQPEWLEPLGRQLVNSEINDKK
jgi:spore maturation protein CgeB